jgi:YggT family protein
MAGNFIIAAAEVLNILLELYTWIIIIAAIISWVSPDPYNPIVRFLYRITAPVLNPVRRLVGNRLGPIDISPLLVILAIFFLQKFLVRSLIEFGYRLKGGLLG